MHTIDWEESDWDRGIAAIAKLVKEASLGWTNRRFSPTDTPETISKHLTRPTPWQGKPLEELVERLRSLIPLSVFNGHPQFFGYITSSPDPIGVLADFFASALNQNNNILRVAPAAGVVELQTIDWLKEMLGIDQEAEGIFSSGGQFANLIALTTIRRAYCGPEIRQQGLQALTDKQLRFYVSDQAHYCHRQAMDLLGLGADSLRLVPCDDNYQLDPEQLCSMIDEDTKQGFTPAAIIATAGTVGVGAVDPIDKLIVIARQRDMWLHVDGAYGVPAVGTPSAPQSLAAIREADSIAFDPHKWLYAPIDAGVTIVRKRGMLRQTFGQHVSYLDHQADNASGPYDLVDLTPENSRPFRALKVWLALQVHGIEGYRAMIERDLVLARHMEATILKTPGLQMAAPVTLSIVCWRVVPTGCNLDQKTLNQLQLDVLQELERRGEAYLSKAELKNGCVALRACIVNFRTEAEHVDRAVTASAQIGQELIKKFIRN